MARWHGFGITPVDAFLEAENELTKEWAAKYRAQQTVQESAAVENYLRRMEREGPSVADIVAHADTKLAKAAEQYRVYIERGFNPITHRRYPTLSAVGELATRPLWLFEQTPVGQFLARASEAAAETFLGIPGYAKQMSPTGEYATTGNPTVDAVAANLGSAAATLFQFGLAGNVVGSTSAALGQQFPKLARAAQLVPSALRAAGTGAATGAAYAGIEAVKGVPITAKDVARQAMFAGGAGLGGALARQGMNVALPGLNKYIEAAATGAGAGVGATAAAYPFSDKKGLEYLKEAGVPIASMVLLHSALALVSPSPTAEFKTQYNRMAKTVADGAKAAKAGDQRLLAAKYRDFWEHVNAAFSVGKRIVGGLGPKRLTPEIRARFDAAWHRAVTPTNSQGQPAPKLPLPAPPGQTAPAPAAPSPAGVQAPVPIAVAPPGGTQAQPPVPQPTAAPIPIPTGISQEPPAAVSAPIPVDTPPAVETPPTEAPRGPRFQVSPDDLDFQTAVRAYQWNSMNPEGRARADQQAYVQHVLGVYDKFKPLAGTPEQQSLLDSEMERYRQGYLERLKGILAARGRTASTMVTGPAKFNTARNKKALNAEMDKIRALEAWQQRMQKEIENKLRRAQTPEQASNAEYDRLMKRIVRVVGDLKAIEEGTFPYPKGSFNSSGLAGMLRRSAAQGNTEAVSRALQKLRELQAKHLKRPVFSERNSIWQLMTPVEAQGAPVEGATAPTPPTTPPAVETPPTEAPGAPVNAIRGATALVKTERGTAVDTQYAVVSARDLITSHTIGLGVNPAYPQELQPRDRTRAASEYQIRRIVNTLDPSFLGENPKASEGAPIVGPDMVVESGNARSIALQRSYAFNTPGARAYREWLVTNAGKFGLDPAALQNIPDPVLVRVRQTEVDRPTFVREANEQAVAAMSATEQAMSDATRLTPGMMSRFMPTEDGEILNAANRDFIGAFMQNVVGPAERARYLTSDGSLSQEGVNRIRNAVFAKAYGDPAILEKLAESTDSNVKNVTGAMLIAAPRYADIQDRIAAGALHPLDLTKEFAAAANKLSALREQGQSLETYLSQIQLFSDESDLSPEAKRVLEIFWQYSRSRKRMVEIMQAAADAVEAAGMPGQGSLFGEAVIPTKMEILEAAVRKVALARGESGPTPQALFPDESTGAAPGGATPVGPHEAGGSGAPFEIETPSQVGGVASSASVGTYAPSKPPAPGEPGSTVGARVELPELVELAREINEGKYPSIRERLSAGHGQALGVFRHKDSAGQIALRADIFLGREIASATAKPVSGAARKELMDSFRQRVAEKHGMDPESLSVRYEYNKKRNLLILRAYEPDKTLAPKVLAHEIGHLVDWLPDHVVRGRGNILGHIAALKKYLATTIGELPQTPDDFLSGQERAELRRKAWSMTESDDPEARKEEAKGIYQTLVAETIEERNLVTRDEIMEELKALSQRWKPFDETESAGYTKYRYSPPELYADAVSVLFNDSTIAAEVAPRFTRMFEAYAERRPEVRKALQAIQNRYADRDTVVSRRLDDIYAMQERGNVVRAEAAKRGERGRESIYDTLMKGLVDAQHPMLKGIRQREQQGGDVAEAAKTARYELEESRYIASEIDDYLYQINTQLLKHMTKADVSYEDVGTYMFLRRVGADRAELANPLGHTPETAAETLEGLKKRLGEQKFAAVQQVVEGYRQLREQFIFPRIEQAGLYSDELMEVIKANKDYGKFSVTRYLEDKYGRQVSAAIHRQIGTLSEIENPFVATVLQDISMLRAAKMNTVKRALVADLQNAGTITKADMRYSQDISGMVPKPPKNPELGLLTVMERGKPVHYYVDREIAKTFEYDPTKALAATQWWGVVNGVLRDLFVSKNPLWQARNVIRDFSSTYKNLESIGLADALKLARTYRQALKEVRAEVFRGERSEDISAALREYALPTNRVYSTRDVEFETEIDRLVHDFLQSIRPEDMPRSQALRRWNQFIDFLNRTGRVSELTGKVAGYKYLKKHAPEMPVQQRAHTVRTRVGTPDYMRRGAWNTVTNNIFLFSNVNKEGLRSAKEAYQANPARYVWKTILVNVLPKVILRGISVLGAGSLAAKVVDKIDPYDRRNYIVVPLGLVNNEQDAIYLRIPQDYEGQAIGAVVHDLLEGKIGGKEGALATLGGMNPYQLNPLLDVAYKAFQVGVLDIAPVDEYRGRPVVSDQGMAAGGAQKFKEFGAYAWNELGGTLLYRMPTGPEIETEESAFQQLLRSPGGNILGTFLRISHNGETSKVYEIKDKVRRDQARQQIARREETIKAINAGKDLTQTYAILVGKGLLNPAQTSINEFRSTYESLAVRKGDDPWEIGIATATSIAERKALFDAMPPEKRATFEDRYNVTTGELRPKPRALPGFPR